MSTMLAALWKRQQGQENGAFGDDDEHNGNYNNYDGYDSWWWSPAGMAVRYAIVAILFGSILLFLIGGYYSTQRRLRRGQPPRPAFRWMVRRRQAYYPHPHAHHYHQQYPRQQQYAYYADPNSQAYGMEGYPPPPPPYDRGDAPPPVYQPPQGGSKAMPDQSGEGMRATGGGAEASSSVGVEQPPPAARL